MFSLHGVNSFKFVNSPSATAHCRRARGEQSNHCRGDGRVYPSSCMTRARPWYDSYETLREEVNVLREKFHSRCKELDLEPATILEFFRRDIVARAVFESNWQEGIQVDQGRTKELADIVFEDFDKRDDPHIDFARVLNHHRNQVLALRRKRVPKNELAAINLSAAHRCLWWITNELAQRETAALAAALKGFQDHFPQIKNSMPNEARAKIEAGFVLIKEMLQDPSAPAAPFTGPFKTTGELFGKYLDCDFQNVLHPFQLTHLHFLHRVLLMGIVPAEKCGHFRRKSVHVSNPDMLFPPAEAVPAMMQEFCHDFPWVTRRRKGSDRILTAATFSFRLVRIHPYSDGNGRVSRLLMNLLLLPDDLPVYLKADKKGRHRYSQALRRGDRGNLRPLASLIALSLKEIYTKVIASLERGARPTSSNSSVASRIASKPH